MTKRRLDNRDDLCAYIVQLERERDERLRVIDGARRETASDPDNRWCRNATIILNAALKPLFKPVRGPGETPEGRGEDLRLKCSECERLRVLEVRHPIPHPRTEDCYTYEGRALKPPSVTP